GAEPDGVLKAKLHVGDTLTLDGSASGRVLAAFLPEPRVALLARRGGQLPGAAVLREVRAAGHALSAGRDMPEVMAVAMPVFDAQGACYGALSLVGPVSRFSAEALRPALAKAADVLSHRRG
ncbi:MAG: IclR family transcriptional regulator, partial [Rubrivivax sp.]